MLKPEGTGRDLYRMFCLPGETPPDSDILLQGGGCRNMYLDLTLLFLSNLLLMSPI